MESVKAFFASKAPEVEVIELPTSTATVALAAEAHGVEPGQIAKTLSFSTKDRFGTKPRMLDAQTVLAETSHPVGGVCPFGLPGALPVFCDISLKTYDEVVPAAGATNSAVRIAPQKMADLVEAEWVDVCQ
ncbi:hypothetical protein H721_02626 [Brucella ovis IntaBari-2006-46-332]|nr:hypothetical protein C010_02794 [Brucella ovis 80/125]ENR05792.1 hypothetical protein C961_02494 [Brucella ovis F8/05B]ENS92177.1 hypothetical protein B999_02761 [Brucella ovis 63/96]ENS95689.1 hypothetical protein C009_02642 [Brucella ovis 81/8]ENT75471.1 hypothetical protein H712_02771 [Brucella ovis IntaBari-2009-88-4]ENT77471.1 hypothetical protein H720_02556 [Brucella ovis IntaBari-2006-46-348]ENT80921.1 hypothetical protein H713_02777 [Brucella ovis IntaBari-2010-47-268]ENT85513.1 h